MVFFSRLSLATANQIVVVVVAILFSIVHTLPLLVTAYSGPSTELKCPSISFTSFPFSLHYDASYNLYFHCQSLWPFNLVVQAGAFDSTALLFRFLARSRWTRDFFFLHFSIFYYSLLMERLLHEIRIRRLCLNSKHIQCPISV